MAYLNRIFIAFLLVCLISAQDAGHQQATIPVQPIPAQPVPSHPSQPQTPKVLFGPQIQQLAVKLQKAPQHIRQKIQQKLANNNQQAYQLYLKYKQERNKRLAQENAQMERLQAQARPQLTHQQILLNAQRDQYLTFRQTHDFQKDQQQLNFQLEQYMKNDFQITLSQQQNFRLYFQAYANTNQVFSNVDTITDINHKIVVQIYEQNHRMVKEIGFYSLLAMEIEGRTNTTYLIRVTNQAENRLIFMKVSTLVESHHVKDALTAEEAANHAQRFKALHDDIRSRLKATGKAFLLQQQNKKQLTEGLDRYYFSVITEMLVLLALGVLQVECIKRLFNTQSII